MANVFTQGRAVSLRIVILLLVVAFGGRLFYLQVMAEEYKKFAEANAMRKQVIVPPRGLIYDRDSQIIVTNSIIYDIMITEADMGKHFDTLSFCRYLGITKAEFESNFAAARKLPGFARYRPFAIVKQLSPRQYGVFQEQMFQFPSVFVEKRLARRYLSPIAAHVLGYTGEVNAANIEAAPDYYRMGDYIGKSGLELSYEKYLRGEKGVKHVLVDVLNREQGSFAEGRYDIPAEKGASLVLGLDKDLQEYAEWLMQGKRGSAVAIEPSTGEILCMVSTPNYPPDLLIGRDRGKNYRALLEDKEKPLFNRAIGARYPPGSTIKPVEALIGMAHGVIGPNFSYTCGGGYRVGSHVVGCHSAGTFDVFNSIRLSCNSYYCHLFKMIVEKPEYGSPSKGLEVWANSLNKYGLGKKLGVDIPHENSGFVPHSPFFNKLYGERRWHATTIISLGIGQAEIGMTCLQLANNAAVIANRGWYFTPHFVRALDYGDSSSMLEWERHYVDGTPEMFELVVEAMQAVVDRGTASMARIKDIQVCGKTGTAQNPHGEDHALFIAFAPKENPKIAVAVIVENAGFGGTWAAPTAGLIIEKYLNGAIARPKIEEWVRSNQYIIKQQLKEQAAAAAAAAAAAKTNPPQNDAAKAD